MVNKLRYGMVGGGPGAFVGEAHRRSINLDGNAELVAGCFSQSYENTLEIGKQLGLDAERCYESYQIMAQSEGKRSDCIDFVVIVTPNTTHYEICKAFLKAGIHISCEKPLAINISEAEEIAKLTKEKDLLFMVNYIYTGHVTAKQAREIILAGGIGTVRTIMAEYPQGWLAHEGENGGKQGSWRCDPKRSGNTNCLGDLGTHIENMISTMTGLKTTRVLAKMDVVVPGRVLDDNDFVMVEYNNGATGLYWASQIAIGHDNSFRVRIYGDGGSIHWFQEEPEKLIIIKKDGTLSEYHRGYSISGRSSKYTRLPAGHPEGYFEALANLYNSFMNCIVHKNAGTLNADMVDFPTVNDGVEGVRFVEACIKSSAKGNVWVNI